MWKNEKEERRRLRKYWFLRYRCRKYRGLCVCMYPTTLPLPFLLIANLFEFVFNSISLTICLPPTFTSSLVSPLTFHDALCTYVCITFCLTLLIINFINHGRAFRKRKLWFSLDDREISKSKPVLWRWKQHLLILFEDPFTWRWCWVLYWW